jgi:hypothetical protein
MRWVCLLLVLVSSHLFTLNLIHVLTVGDTTS